MPEIFRPSENESAPENPPKLILPGDVLEQLQKERGQEQGLPKQTEEKPAGKIIIEESVGRTRTEEEQKNFQGKIEEGEKIIKNKRYIEQREKAAKEASEKGDLPDVVYDKERIDKLFEDRAKKRGEDVAESLNTEKPETKPEEKPLPQAPQKPVESEIKATTSPLETFSINTETVNNIEGKEFSAQTEEIQQRVLEAEKKQKIERAREILLDSEDGKRQLTELAEAIKEITERDLTEEGKKMAENNFAERGVKIAKISEVEPQLLTKEIERIKGERYSESVLACQAELSKLPLKQQKIWGVEGGKIDNTSFTVKLDAKMAELGISKEVFSQLTREKFDVLNIKKHPWYTKWWFGSAIEVPSSDGRKPLAFSEKKFNAWLGAKNSETQDALRPGSIQSEAQKRVSKRIIEGRNRLLKERQFCFKNIVKSAVEDYKKQQEKAPEQTEVKEQTEVRPPEGAGKENEEKNEKKKPKTSKPIKISRKPSSRFSRGTTRAKLKKQGS